MKISFVHRKIAQGHGGTFRALSPGEIIEAADILVHDTFYDYVSEQHIGSPAEKGDRIIRLEFPKKGDQPYANSQITLNSRIWDLVNKEVARCNGIPKTKRQAALQSAATTADELVGEILRAVLEGAK